MRSLDSAPSPRGWDAYVESCAAAAAAGGGAAPRVGDVEAVRDALDWTFRGDNGGAGRAYDLPPPRAGGVRPAPFGFSVNAVNSVNTERRVAERGSWDERAPSRDVSYATDVAYRADPAPRVGQKRRPPSPVAAYDRAPEAAPALSRRRVENDLHAPSNAPASLDRDPNESSWVMDTRGNNGLVVGVRGENVKRVEPRRARACGARRTKSTVVLSGAPAEVALARRMVEATLRQAGIEPGGAHGAARPCPRGRRASRAGTSPGRERIRP